MCHAYVNFSVALQMIENGEWLIHQRAVLPFTGTSAHARNGKRGALYSSTRGNAEPCSWGGITPCIHGDGLAGKQLHRKGPAGPSKQQVALEQRTPASKEANSTWIALGNATSAAGGMLFFPSPLPSDKTPAVLYPVLGSTVQGGHGLTWNKVYLNSWWLYSHQGVAVKKRD